MGLLDMLKKDKQNGGKCNKVKVPAFVKQSGVKCKEFSFEAIKTEVLDAMVEGKPDLIPTLTPSNYYASKASYLLAKVYYLPDYSKIMINITYYVADRPRHTTIYREISYDIMKRICERFGQYI